jgi:very-short-patch-repair endonuclease
MEHNKELTPLAQKLRKGMTKEEKRLWYDYLKAYPTPFRRQVTYGRYIMDFYCPKANLAIELDGFCHRTTEQAKKDKERTDFLNEGGIQVIRFSNKEIWQRFERVCAEIDTTVKKRIQGL